MPTHHVRMATLTLTLLTAAHAQTNTDVLNLEPLRSGSDAPTTPSGGAASPYSEFYPIKINLPAVTRAGVTPNTGYVLLRDLKSVLDARLTGDLYSLHTPGSALQFRAGSRSATFNGRPASLNATPVRLPDTLLFPLKSLGLLGCSAQPLAAQQDNRPYRVTCVDSSVIVSAVVFRNSNPAAGALVPDVAAAARLRAQALRSGR